MAIYKNKDLEIDISVGVPKIQSGGAPFYTEDKGSTSIRIKVFHKGKPFNFDNSNMVPTLDLFHSDGSIWMDEPVTIVMSDYGVIDYNIPDKVIQHAGTVQVKLFLKNADTSVHALNFDFKILDSGVQGAVDKEIDIVLVEDTIRKIISENAIELLDESFKVDVFNEFKNYTAEHPEEFKGEHGIDGLKGEKGDKGDQGPQGVIGLKGEKGDKGDKGDDGAQGLQGVQGPKGNTGNDGADALIAVSANEPEKANVWFEVLP